MTQEDSPLGEVVKDLVENKGGVVSPIILLAQKETRASNDLDTYPILQRNTALISLNTAWILSTYTMGNTRFI